MDASDARGRGPERLVHYEHDPWHNVTTLSVYDLAGSYNPALIAAGVALVLAVLLVNRLGAYVYPVQPPVEPQFASQPAMT